jgi:hypothetical protein
MFILLMFILAYRHRRAGANGTGQTPVRNLITIARSTGEHRGQMANRQRYKAHWPATTARTQCLHNAFPDQSSSGGMIRDNRIEVRATPSARSRTASGAASP